MIRARCLFVLILCVASLAVARAGTFPDAWQGDLALSNVMPPQSVKSATVSLSESGKIPFSVSNSKITGEADVPYANDVAAGGCTMKVRGAMHQTLSGTVTGGTSLEFSFHSAPVNIAGTIKCPNKPAVNFPIAPQPASGGQVKIPLRDGAGGDKTLQFGATMNSSVKLVTPCENWDQGKPPGPKIEFLPKDPRTVPAPKWKADYSKTIAALTQLDPRPASEGKVARAIGLTLEPGQAGFLPHPDLGTSVPRKPIYKSCDWANSVMVVIPYEVISSYVATEIGALKAGDPCRSFVEAHEAKHFDAIQAMMRKIAADIEAKFKTDVPGPNNAALSVTGGGGGILKTRIEHMVFEIVQSNYAANQTAAKALDDQDYPQIQQLCKSAMSKH